MDKLITFAVPCYNSAAYMEHCVDTLLQGGDDIEIILVDDGSTKDNTAEICDRYAAQHPNVVRAIHQENGGHGEGVNQGLRNARGVYYKVVDSDDWVDVPALHTALDKLRQFVRDGKLVDMLICNYVYEHVEDNTQRVNHYNKLLPTNRVFGWDAVAKFRPDQFIMMHNVIYRTQLLRDCGLDLPKHTFYVDSIFVYEPLPYVKNMYYLDVDLYRYFIGREDQSVNEQVMLRRIDQQLRVNYHMLDSHDLNEVAAKNKQLGAYMFNYLAIMVTVSSIFLDMDGSDEAMEKRKKLWDYIKEKDAGLYRRMRYFSLPAFTYLPGKAGRKISLALYRAARKIYKFN